MYTALINWVVIIVGKEIGNLVRTNKSTFFIKWYRQWTVTCSNLQNRIFICIFTGKKIGLSDGIKIEIKEGLAENEKVRGAIVDPNKK